MKKTVVSVATLTALAGTSVANIQAQEVTVKSGDSLWGIANAVGTTVADLKSANNLSSNLIHPGDVLSYSQSFTNNNANTYTVKAGDTLWAIGNEYGVSYKVIMEANNLKTDLILPGQTLKLNVDKVEEVSAPKVAIESIDATKVEKTQSATDAYVIQSGDTLYKISRETGVELNTLKAVNGLKSDLIFPGQVLVLKGEVETPVVEQVVTEEAKVVEHTPVVEEVTEVVTEEAEVVEHTPVVEEVTEVVTEEAEVVEHTPVVEETSETVEDVSAAQKAEADRQAAIKAEQQRIAAQKAEADRQAAIKAEQQRIAAQKAEADRQAAIKAEQQRVAAQKAEADRQAAIKAEQQRVAAQKAEADRQAAIKAEQQRVAAQKAEADRQAAIKAEQQRIAAQKAEADRQATIKAEQQRIAAQQEQQRQAKLAAEKKAAEKAANPVSNTTSKPVSSYGQNFYYYGDCAWYAFERRKELGKSVGNMWGNAHNWADNARSNGYNVNNTPSVGAIVHSYAGTNGAYGMGHVAVVESINPDGSITVSEMGWPTAGFKTIRTISASKVASHNFIH